MTSRDVSCELGSDHGGFVVDGVTSSYDSSPVLVENTLLRWWPDTDPELEGFSVAAGSQWGPFAVTLRAHEGDPGPLDDLWEDVVEVSVQALGSVMISEVVDGPVGELDHVTGSHRMRVAARGRTESAARDVDVDADEDEDPTPLEYFVVDLWPAAPAPAVVARQESRYARDVISPPAPAALPEEAAGTAAAWAIIRDVRGESGARDIPGGLGQIVVEREFVGTTTKAFNRFRYVHGWPPCNGMMGSADEYAQEYYDATLPGEPHGSSRAGFIATRLLDLEKPRRVKRTWNWALPTSGSIDEHPLLLPEDSTFTVTITRSHEKGEEPRALVRVVHDGAPAAWADDLEKLWAWHLAVWAES